MKSDYDLNIDEVTDVLRGSTPERLAILYRAQAAMPELAETDFLSDILEVLEIAIETIANERGEEFVVQFATKLLDMRANKACLEYAVTVLMPYIGNGDLVDVVFWGRYVRSGRLSEFLGEKLEEWIEEGYVSFDKIQTSGYINNYKDLLARWQQTKEKAPE